MPMVGMPQRGRPRGCEVAPNPAMYAARAAATADSSPARREPISASGRSPAAMLMRDAGGRDGGVVVQHAQRERLEDDGLGEGALDREDRRPREVELALAVARDRAGEAVVLEEREGRGIHDLLVAEEAQLVVAEAEVADEAQQAAGAGDDAEAAAAGEPAAEQLEHAAAMSRAVAECGVEHRELVAVGVQRRSSRACRSAY